MTQQVQPLEQQFFPITLISSCSLPELVLVFRKFSKKQKPTKASTNNLHTSTNLLNVICNFALTKRLCTKLNVKQNLNNKTCRYLHSLDVVRVSFDSPSCWLNCERMCLRYVLGSRHLNGLCCDLFEFPQMNWNIEVVFYQPTNVQQGIEPNSYKIQKSSIIIASLTTPLHKI